MSRKVQALVVRPDGSGDLVDIAPSLEGIKPLVGGYIERVTTTGAAFAAWHAYCDEEGKIKGLDVNVAATAIARQLGWSAADVLCGPVVFLGTAGPEEGDVPAVVVQVARQCGLDV